MATEKTLIIVLLIHVGILSFAQSRIDSMPAQPDSHSAILQNWSASAQKKAEKLQEKIIAKSTKTLRRLQRQEEKIYRKMLQGKDSLQAKAALTDIRSRYQSFQHKLRDSAFTSHSRIYIPRLDTLSTALKFLDQQGAGGKVKDALTQTQSLQDKLQQAEDIKSFIRERKEQLKEQLEKLGLAKQLKRFNKEVYYYSAQLKGYKELLRNPKKAEQKALSLLTQTKLFKDFMRKNSQLSSLFGIPGNPNDPLNNAGLAGLQTRVQVNALIQQQIAAGGPGARDQLRQNLQAAQSQLDQLKNKITQHGGSSSNDVVPEGFKPNNQKTRSFLQRLEYGTNMQTQKSTSFFPVTSDIGLSVGYKLNDKSVIGIGASYKMGWGKGWKDITITNEGLGLRSFIDWKLKGSFWISGGYEQNYKTAFRDFDQLIDRSGWQQSGLIGLSKVISLKKKFFKKTKLQLLWDFLSYQQLPRTQPILFRVGYNF